MAREGACFRQNPGESLFCLKFPCVYDLRAHCQKNSRKYPTVHAIWCWKETMWTQQHGTQSALEIHPHHSVLLKEISSNMRRRLTGEQSMQLLRKPSQCTRGACPRPATSLHAEVPKLVQIMRAVFSLTDFHCCFS